MLSYLPTHEGWLPSWLLLVSLVSILNTLQIYSTNSLDFSRRVYAGPATTSTTQITTLSSRTFGTWTLLSGVVRFFAAYRIDDEDFYALAFASYAIALAHFATEWAVYGTVKRGKGIAPTACTAVISTVWMLVQWKWYTK